MANALENFANQLGRGSIKSVKVETSLFDPITLTGDEIFPVDTGDGSAPPSAAPAKASWVLNYIRPAVTLEMSDALHAAGMAREIVIAPAGLPTSTNGWMGLVFGLSAGAFGIFALGYWLGGRRSV